MLIVIYILKNNSFKTHTLLVSSERATMHKKIDAV